LSISVRKCQYCDYIEKNPEAIMAQSVYTGLWVCIKCFEKRQKVKTGIKT